MFGGTESHGSGATAAVPWTTAVRPGVAGSGGNATYIYGAGGHGGLVAVFYVGI